jgi:hypothetical protein
MTISQLQMLARECAEYAASVNRRGDLAAELSEFLEIRGVPSLRALVKIITAEDSNDD